MLHQIFTIHDITAELYTQPFFGINDQVAIRSCQNLVQHPGTAFFDNPEDFRLFHIGSFNDETLEIIQTGPRLIVRLSDLMIKNYPQETENNEN